jgi:hypothetical protein
VQVNSFSQLEETKAKVVKINTVICDIDELKFNICNPDGFKLKEVQGKLPTNITDYTEHETKKVLVKLTVSKSGDELDFIKAEKIPNTLYVKERKDLVLVKEKGGAYWR